MKKFLFLMMVSSAAVLTSCNNKPAAEETSAATADSTAAESTYSLNTDSTSFVQWKGVMLGVKEHFGKISFKEGRLTTKGGQLAGGSFVVDMSTIVPLDAAYDEKKGSTKDKLVGHLSSPDFFDIANNPTASFAISSVEGNTAKGTLTIRGKANEETLTNIALTEADGALKATGSLKFDRKKYDVAFDMPVKDMVISNDIELNIELTAKK